jgi:hypothetical protein
MSLFVCLQFLIFSFQIEKMLGPDFQPRAAYRTLRIIFLALNTGLLIFFMVGIYLNEMQIPAFKEQIDILTVVNIFLLAAIPVGYTLSNRRMEAINPKDPLPKKFEQFQAAMILRWAMIEGSALFSLVGFILLQDAKQIVLFILCILVLSLNTVSKEKVIRMAKLNAEEAKALED